MGLVAWAREAARAAQGGDRVRRGIVDAHNRRLVAAADIHQRGSQPQPEAEFARSGGVENVGFRKTYVLLPVVLVGPFPNDDLGRPAVLPAVLITDLSRIIC